MPEAVPIIRADFTVSGKLGVNEFLDLRIIEKQILKIGIEQAQVCHGRLSQERQVCALGRLDDPPWNFLRHEFIASLRTVYRLENDGRGRRMCHPCSAVFVPQQDLSNSAALRHRRHMGCPTELLLDFPALRCGSITPLNP